MISYHTWLFPISIFRIQNLTIFSCAAYHIVFEQRISLHDTWNILHITWNQPYHNKYKEVHYSHYWPINYSPGILKLNPWWRHQMETFPALLAICAGNSPVTGEFPAQRPVARSFDIFFDLRLNKRLSKQSWFDALSHPLWRHWNAGEFLATRC